MTRLLTLCFLTLALTSCNVVQSPEAATKVHLIEELPDMRWSHVPDHAAWNIAAVKALNAHGQPLVDMVPSDIDRWCPAYEAASPAQREAFWVGFLSALAKHESTYKPAAVSPNGKWFGLLQISPATARGYECRAGSGAALKDGGENLSCAIRIMAVTVPRDGVIAHNDGRWRGVAADWGPMRVGSKRQDIAAWLNAQSFCAASN
jgi:hypothetical protein